MELTEYLNNINALLLDATDKIAKPAIVPAANELLANIKNRIVREGKNSNEQGIGNYSTKPSYYTKQQFDKKSSFTPRGKNATGDFANGRQRKSMYFTNGYKGLRAVQGKPTDKVVLNYTGDTMAAYQQQITDKDVVQGMVNKEASDIRKGHEKRRNMDIYKPSPREIKEYQDNVADSVIEITTKILSGVSE